MITARLLENIVITITISGIGQNSEVLIHHLLGENDIEFLTAIYNDKKSTNILKSTLQIILSLTAHLHAVCNTKYLETFYFHYVH